MSEEVTPVEEVVESHKESAPIVNESVEANADEVVEYTPNYNYKFKDEERAFDERFHTVIRSKEDEEYLRELYTKADGLDTYKGKYTDLESQTNALLTGYQNLEEIQKAEDMAKLQEVFKFSDDVILKRAEEILSFQDLPDKERESIATQKRLESELNELRHKFETNQSSAQNHAIEEDMRVMNTMIKDKYSDVAKAMQANGKDMAWMVGQIGSSYFKKTGVEPTVESVVDEVASMYQYLLNNNTQAAPAAAGNQQQATIPSLQGNTVNPVRAPIRSIDDLRKLASMIPSR